jgi:hypothetical protein
MRFCSLLSCLTVVVVVAIPPLGQAISASGPIRAEGVPPDINPPRQIARSSLTQLSTSPYDFA